MATKLFSFSCCLMLIFLSEAKSQANVYHPFHFDQNPEWRVDYYYPYFCGGLGCGVCYQYQYFAKGDTVINSLDYYKVFVRNMANNDSEFIGSIREDTIQEKVYLFYSSFPEETLLYDFNLQVGDTLNLYNRNGVVESIDSILIGTDYHRRINFFNCCEFQVSIIEGVGSTTGLIEGFGPSTGFEGVLDDLKCFKLNSTLKYLSTLFTCTQCDFAVNISDNPKQENAIFYPTPADKNISLNFQTPVSSIRLFSTDGNLLQQLHPLHQSKFDLDVSDLSSGMYFMEAFSNNKIYRGKILVSH